MTDKEQVMYDIERCICHVPDACKDCSKHRHFSGNAVTCMESLMEDALALLNEQQKLIDDITQRRINNGEFD